MPDPWTIAANTGRTCRRCSALDPSDYIQCHHCGAVICCPTESEDTLNACKECFETEALRLETACRVLHRQAEGWKDKYLALEAAVSPSPIRPVTESLIAARKLRMETATQ